MLRGLYLRLEGLRGGSQPGCKEGGENEITGVPSTPGVCVSSPFPLCSDLPVTDETLISQPKKELENFI